MKETCKKAGMVQQIETAKKRLSSKCKGKVEQFRRLCHKLHFQQDLTLPPSLGGNVMY